MKQALARERGLTASAPRRRGARHALLTAGVVIGLFLLGCSQKSEAPLVAEARDHDPAAPPKKPIDRLAEGELAPGKQMAFGFLAPRNLTLDAAFPKSAYFSGQVDPLLVASYVKGRVSVSHAEVAPNRTIFDRAKIKGGDPNKIYRLQIVRAAFNTRLIIEDITPPPPVLGLSETERWARVGMKPTGELLDPLKME